MAAKKKSKRAAKRAPAKKRTAKRKPRQSGRTKSPKRGGSSPANGAPNESSSGNAQPTALHNDAVGPNGIRVRMYRVGFGDFFLLSLNTPNGLKHILIDCGVHACDIHTINTAVAQMAQDTGGNLSLVIMTHRHADHISGFARCKDVFSQFTVEQVWMSWFEDPSDNQAANFQRSLTMVAQQLKVALAARNSPEDDELDFMAENVTGEPLPLSAGGGASGSNAIALEVLHGGFKNKAPVAYYKAGDPPILPQDLVDAGLTAQILGPPHDLTLVAQMSGKNEEYLAANDPAVSAPIEPFDRVFRIKGANYLGDAFHHYGRKDVEKAVNDVQPDMLAAKAKQVDNTLNNQSLVVLFTFNKKHLLFAGDAQWGNWENFLYGGKIGTGRTTLTDTSKSILASLDFYKVGHHGSTNATPKDALNAMREGCVAMVSTQPGCYGKASSGTEVPRLPLLAAIEKKTDNQLARSDQIKVGDVKPSPDLDAPGKPFSAGDCYIDYNL
jgi:beta-lactamase superfamily II metal-dependent hydrolase